MPDVHIDQGASLRGLLAHYDERVRGAIREATDATTGTGRVQAVHALGRLISAHDAVLGAALCPLLQDLPGGAQTADRLRHGCEERESLLGQFYALGEGTDAHNVYPVFGAEVERILEELDLSFARHAGDETARVGELLESAEAIVSPEAVAARMAIEGGRAPGRPHRAVYRHPQSRLLRALYRNMDRLHDWNDSHHGWPSSSRRRRVSVRPRRNFDRRTPSVRDLLSGYDQTVEDAIAQLGTAGSSSDRAGAAYRLAAAVSIHDSIVGGTLCQLLEAVPEGRPAAAALREGCQKRAALLRQWDDLVADARPSELFAGGSGRAEQVIAGLVASFRSHEGRETDDVSALVEQLRGRSWTFSGTGLVSPYLLPDWPNPEPAVLAAHMALWGEKAPTHTHPALMRHPASRFLRDFYRRTDYLRDRARGRRGWPTLT